MAMMALIDSRYRCLYVSYGSPGSESDSQIFNASNLRRLLERRILPENDFIVGDDAFSLQPYLMKPFSGHRLTKEQRIFNYRLSRARNVVENFFGMLTNRFRIFLHPIGLNPATVEKVIKVVCIIHNYLLDQPGYLLHNAVDRWDRNNVFYPGSWRDGVVPDNDEADEVRPVQRTSQSATGRRESLMRFVNGVGAVPWQENIL